MPGTGSSISGKARQKNQRERTARDKAGVHSVELCDESDQQGACHIAKLLKGLRCTQRR